MSEATDLQNLTRRFWAGEKSAINGGGELIEILDIEGTSSFTGFTLNSMREFSRRDDFPSPVARTGRRLFWRKDDVAHWLKLKRQSLSG
jgi:predicted DNA-binding transcriptional regulator AlpA